MYPYGSDGGVFAALFVGLGFLVVGLAVYALTAFFLMKLLNRAGYNKPWSAWVPILNGAALLELAGFSNPWPWVGILFAGSVLSMIPFIGLLISLAVMALAVVLMVWVARGVQAALGIDSTPGIVLAVLLPWVWIIWMSVTSNNTQYTLSQAQHVAQTFPLQWFKPNPQYPSSAFQ